MLIYIRDQFQCEEVAINVKLEGLALRITLSTTMKFNLCVLYNPPSHSVNFYNEFKSLLSNMDCSESIILGDFNINWLEKSSKMKLKVLVDKFKYKQLIDKPTRVTRSSKTLIDLILTNRPERITKTYNLITGLSDHNMTLIVRKLGKKRLTYYNQETKIQKIGIPKAKQNNFEEELNQINWDNVTQESNVNQSANIFVTTLSNTIKKFTKTWTSKPKNSLPWFNGDIWHIMKKRDTARKKSMKTRNGTDHLIYTTLRNQVISNLRKAKTDYFTKKIEEANGSSYKLWQHINYLTNPAKKKHIMIDSIKVDGTLVNNNESMANVFNTFFIDSVHELANKFKNKVTC